MAKIRPDHSIFFQRDFPTPEKRLAGAAVVMTQLAGLAKGSLSAKQKAAQGFARL